MTDLLLFLLLLVNFYMLVYSQCECSSKDTGVSEPKSPATSGLESIEKRVCYLEGFLMDKVGYKIPDTKSWGGNGK